MAHAPKQEKPMAHDRLVGGLRCLEVLEVLSDFIDDELAPPVRAKVDAHLRGCGWCAQFGGEVGDTIVRLRGALAVPAPLPDEVATRLYERLRGELPDPGPDE
jgi:anti-sigma factor RsiW